MKVTKQHALAAVVVVTTLAMAVDAQAFWGSRGSWGGGSRGSWGSGGGWGSRGGSFGSRGGWGSRGGGSWGSRGGWGSRGSYGGGILRRAFRGGSHGSYGGGSYGGSHGGYVSHSHGSYGGSYGGHTVSHVSYSTPVYSHGSGGGVIHSGPVYESAPTEVHYDGHASTGVIGNTIASTDKGTLRVSVPAGAIVHVNDTLTKSTGTERHFVSRGLQSGQVYNYTVRAEFERDGQTVTESKSATLTAGGDSHIVFSADADADQVASEPQPVTTELSLTVPAEAKVTLAGNVTTQTGSSRTFATTQLAQGQSWENYTIRVQFEQDGQTVTQERTITLTGGQSQQLTFTADGPLLAAR